MKKHPRLLAAFGETKSSTRGLIGVWRHHQTQGIDERTFVIASDEAREGQLAFVDDGLSIQNLCNQLGLDAFGSTTPVATMRPVVLRPAKGTMTLTPTTALSLSASGTAQVNGASSAERNTATSTRRALMVSGKRPA